MSDDGTDVRTLLGRRDYYLDDHGVRTPFCTVTLYQVAGNSPRAECQYTIDYETGASQTYTADGEDGIEALRNALVLLGAQLHGVMLRLPVPLRWSERTTLGLPLAPAMSDGETPWSNPRYGAEKYARALRQADVAARYGRVQAALELLAAAITEALDAEDLFHAARFCEACAGLCKDAGLLEQRIGWIERAISISPGLLSLRLPLAEAHHACGHTQAALAVLDDCETMCKRLIEKEQSVERARKTLAKVAEARQVWTQV
ncbi:MAG: hypothetical protein H6509_11880 [Bryobacterales bacterium]|nr:hypothetical protein [Bryobacterales bacterium]